MKNKPQLNRSLSLFLTTTYGLGTILGAGIYVLIGKIAGIAGMYAPWSFLIALLLAAFTALSYAELSSRYPESAGEATYVQKAFNNQILSTIIGLLIMLTGLFSTATLLHGFIGYLHPLLPLNQNLLAIVTLSTLGLICISGIKTSLTLASIITIVEILGLLLIIWTAREHFSAIPNRIDELIPSMRPGIWSSIFVGGFVAFYAFIGFEDIVNIAEEVKNPKKNLPRAIFLALSIASIFYIIVTLVCVLAVNPTTLSTKTAPLTYILKTSNSGYSVIISFIALFAIINGALVQIIMCSRLMYGMAKKAWLPSRLAVISASTQTPINATSLVIILTLVIYYIFPITSSAKVTSFIILIVFSLINISLFRIKLTQKHSQGAFAVPIFLPLIGAVLTSLFLLFQITQLLT